MITGGTQIQNRQDLGRQVGRRHCQPAGLYKPPFSDVHFGDPDELFAGKDKMIEGIFAKLTSLEPGKASG